MRRTVPLALLLALAFAPRTSFAQNAGLSGFLLRFFAPSNPVILADTGHAAHFGSQPGAQATLTQLNRGIATQLATSPVGSSSGGFSYVFDPALGVFSRSTDSFGPLFAERANTAGKGKFSMGFNAARYTFDSFEGENLRDGDITLFLTHSDLNRDGDHLEVFFEGDLIRANMFLDVTAETASFFANYGVTDRLDVGLALPYLRIDMKARIHERIQRLSTADEPFVFHIFQNGTDDNEIVASDNAEGLGDLVLRAKYRLFGKSTEGGGLATALDLRLPTADETELLGSGATQLKLYLIASGSGKRFSPHLNLGYTFSRGGSVVTGALPDEFNYVAGFDVAVFNRLTFTADVIGRTLLDFDRIVKVEEEWEYTHGQGGPLEITTITDYEARNDDLNLLVGSVGVKLNPFGKLLLSGNVLLSQGKRGLQDYVTPVVSIDYTF
jgi:hypothetical protein